MNCLRACPTQAIALRKKRVIEERCIFCGQCLVSCPEGHYQSSGGEELKNLLARSGKKLALVHPLVALDFRGYEPEKLAGALYWLGFEQVYLENFGLELVAEFYQNWLRASEPSSVFTSHCPPAVEYIEKFYPELIEHLAGVFSPEYASAQALLELESPDWLVVFTPCPSRFQEFQETEKIISVNIWELKKFFEQEKISLEKIAPGKFSCLKIPEASPLLGEGDLLSYLSLKLGLTGEKTYLISGREQIVRFLKKFRTGEVDVGLVEMNFCPGGCSGGVLLSGHFSSSHRYHQAKRYLELTVRAKQVELQLVVKPELDLSRSFYPQRRKEKKPGAEQVKETLERLGFNPDHPPLNCGSCGYPSCEEFAGAVLKKEAELNYCLPYLVRQISRMDERILRSERLASIGQIASGLAHEINNPLGLASGYAQTLLNEPNLSEGAREVLKVVKEEIENASSIIKQLLSFSREQSREFQEVNLYEVLANTLRLVSPRLETSGVVLNLNYLPDRLWIECDPQGLQQVFTNLIINAWQAMPEGGVLSISVEADSEQVKIKFKDTGVGIAPEHLNRLFDPFFTTKPAGQGTGLGLTMAYKIIEEHGGDIQVKSQPGKGAEFIISLPLRQSRTKRKKNESADIDY